MRRQKAPTKIGTPLPTLHETLDNGRGFGQNDIHAVRPPACLNRLPETRFEAWR